MTDVQVIAAPAIVVEIVENSLAVEVVAPGAVSALEIVDTGPQGPSSTIAVAAADNIEIAKVYIETDY